MPHLLRSGVEAHVFTREEQSRGGRAKAAKYAAEVKEKRRRRRRARYIAEKYGRDDVWRREYEAAGAPVTAPAPVREAPTICSQCGRPREWANTARCRCVSYT